MESWDTITLTEMDKKTEDTWNSGKVPFYFDTTGNAEVFFRYSNTLCELNKTQLAYSIGRKTLDEVKEELRIHFKSAMANGTTLAIFMDKTMGKFNDYFDEKAFPKEIFSPEEIVKKEIYKKILKEDEDKDVHNIIINFNINNV